MDENEPKEIEIDDLISIKGIGAETENSLNELLNIHTYAELSGCSAENIVARLKSAKKRGITLKQVEGWQQEAQKLMDEQSSSSSSVKAVAMDTNPVSRKDSENAWKTEGTFVVEFQSQKSGYDGPKERILCQHHESSEQQEWDGAKYRHVCGWMYSLMHPQSEGHSDSEKQEGVLDDSLKLEITYVRAFQSKQEQPKAVATAGSDFRGILNSLEPVAFEVSFDLCGENVNVFLDQGTSYSAELYAYNRNNLSKIHLASVKPEYMDQNKTNYSLLLPTTNLPSGCYRLELFIGAGRSGELEGNLKIPFLRVA